MMMRSAFRLAAALVLFFPALPGSAGEPIPAKRHMAAAANPLASEAGLAILRGGGSAVDAAVAMQMVLMLVEPQSSGIGGGAFILHYDAAAKAATSYDGRETAPAAARAERFLGPDGKPLSFRQAVAGGLSVGVPGVLRALEMAHKAHGKLPWPRLFQPAIELSRRGFAVSPRLSGALAEEKSLRDDPVARAYFYAADGAPWPPGHVLKNPALAATLEAVAQGGADAFHRGPIAQAIAAAVRGSPRNPGDITADDIASYAAKERPAVCGPYRVWTVCGMGPPSSGGLTVLQILGLVERFDLKAMKPMTADSVHVIAEAMRLAYADRALYMADADFVKVPVKGLADRAYLSERSKLIAPGRAMEKAEPGEPPGRAALNWGEDDSREVPATSHLVAVDAWGDAVSMTTTIEDAFGARLMVNGFLLNNELTDFSFSPVDAAGKPVANRVEAGKRPRSSMAPTLVFDRGGALVLAVGSPGGSAIINYVAKTLIGVLDWGLDIQAAIDLPNFGNRGGATELEKATPAEALKPALEAMGHKVSVIPFVSGLQGIAIGKAGLAGGADPRREGAARGD
jgi:gamma-glutamyltranspeptidase/glutathione hydrolase